MKRMLFLIALVALCNPLWCMENQEKPDALLSELLKPEQRDLRPQITPHLTIMNNDEASPLRKLFQKKSKHFKELPEDHRIFCDEPISDIQFKPNNTTAIITTHREIAEYNLQTKLSITNKPLSPHNLRNQAATLAFISGNTEYVALANHNGQRNLEIYSKTTNAILRDETCRPWNICFSLNNSIIAADDEGQITLFDCSLKKIAEIEYHIPREIQKKSGGSGITALAFSPNNKKLAKIYGCRGVFIFDIETQQDIHAGIITDTEININGIAFLNDNKTIVACTERGEIYSYNYLTAQCKCLMGRRASNLPLHRILAIMYKEQEYVLVSSRDKEGCLILLCVDEKNQEKKIKTLNPEVPKNGWGLVSAAPRLHTAIAVSPDYNHVLVCSPDKTIICFDSRGFFNTVINRLTKLSFAQQILLHAYNKLLAQGKTPVKIEKDTLEEMLIQWIDPLILDILLHEKIVTLNE